MFPPVIMMRRRRLPPPAKLDVVGGGGVRIAVRVGQCGDFRHMKMDAFIEFCHRRQANG